MSIRRRRSVPTRGRVAVLSMIGLLLLGGCGGDEAETMAADPPSDDGGADADGAAGVDGAAADSAAEDEDDDAGAADGICHLLDGVDVEAAFAGTLPLGSPGATTSDNCVVPIEQVGVEGSGVFIRTFDASFYDLREEMAESVPEVSFPELGQGAVLIGNGDLSILVDDETTLVVGIEAFFTESERPSDEVVRAGVLTLAEQVLANYQA